jgi:hypothetical protein
VLSFGNRLGETEIDHRRGLRRSSVCAFAGTMPDIGHNQNGAMSKRSKKK